MSINEIMDVVAQDKGFYDRTEGGLTISGGEILNHFDFVSKLIRASEKRGINVCLDTSGYGNKEELMDLTGMKNVTHILYDMKALDDEIHKKYTGVSNEIILKNLKLLAGDDARRSKIIMRMPLIKGVNDGEEIIERTGKLYGELGIGKVTLLPYHNLGISKVKNLGGSQKEFHPSTESRINEIAAYFRDEIKLTVTIMGRV